MNILISNDDGYLAPGIQELARRIRRFGNVTVVAPEQNHSGASNSLTLNRPLSVRQVQENVFFVNGTPSDCVHIALTGLLPQKPDIVLSGINCGQNNRRCRYGRILVRLPVLCFFSGAFGLVLFGFRRGGGRVHCGQLY